MFGKFKKGLRKNLDTSGNDLSTSLINGYEQQLLTIEDKLQYHYKLYGDYLESITSSN